MKYLKIEAGEETTLIRRSDLVDYYDAVENEGLEILRIDERGAVERLEVAWNGEEGDDTNDEENWNTDWFSLSEPK